MEESAEPHMDTGVSSTTDDVQEVEEVASSASTHHNVETVITVESIEEDDMSPKQSKQEAELIPCDKAEPPKPVPKLSTPHPEPTYKKIIIKSPLKDLQIRPIQKSPGKADEAQMAGSKDLSPIKPSTSQLQPLKLQTSADSSSKTETPKSKDVETSVHSTTVNISDSQKPVQKSPVKESFSPEKISKEAVPKLALSNDRHGANKEGGPPVIIISKGQITKPSGKQTETYVSTIKEGSPNKIVIIKESSARAAVNKELVARQSLTKESAKHTPAKELSGKLIPLSDTSSKEIKQVKDTPSKQTPVKDVQDKKPPTKEVPTKTPIKELPAKTVHPKERLGNTTAKEPPPKTISKETFMEKPAETDDKSLENKDLSKTKNLSLLEDKEASNDSQMETNSDTSDKDHNRSISRELRSLINSAKESKIISECTQLTSKTRKSRTPLDTSSTSLTTSVDAEKIQGVRRSSDHSQRSNSSEKSDKTTLKRSMRSQNPEFVSKVKNFLNSVSGKVQKTDGDVSDEEVAEKANKEIEKEIPSMPKKKKTEEAVAEGSSAEKAMDKSKQGYDQYCWRCHWSIEATSSDKVHPKLHCSVCPRSYHFKCLTSTEKNKVQTDKAWVCPECFSVMQAESSETRSVTMKKISLGMLCDLLRHALERMMEVNGVEPFMHPVSRTEFPDYDSYVVHPMDLTQMKKNIDDGLYGSTEAFLADAQWILHNSIIFNTLQSKLTFGARALVRSCRAEIGEIEACPECYAAAHARRPTWFTDVCSTPHILLWAKLKGFPYWPAKGMSVSNSGLVDVRFFGAHDRAWVPAKDCFLYSEKDPNNFRTKRQDILDSMQEAEQHIRNISRKYGKFVYPPFKTTFDPTRLNQQIKIMIPSFEGEDRSPVKEKQSNSSPVSVKDKNRSNSKGSKGSFNDGDVSEVEDAVIARKMASGAVIPREEEDFAVEKEKDKPMDVDHTQSKESDTRKRRRSELEEAVITIIDTSTEKRKRVESADKPIEKKDAKDAADKKDKEDKSKEEKATNENDKSKTETPDKADSEPSTSTDKNISPKVGVPIRVISIAKVMKNDNVSPKVSLLKEEAKAPKPKTKPDKNADKSIQEEEKKKAKRRNSNKNKSLNNSNAGKADKKSDASNEKAKDNSNKNKESDGNKTTPIKDRIQFDDDTSLAVLARESKNSASTSSLPTISSVRSLSSQSSTTGSKTKSSAMPQSSTSGSKTVEVTVEAATNSSIFTPTSTDNVKNMKEAVDKLQRLRENEQPAVGRVGVRAFARMTSPPEKEVRPNNEVQVEIKTEPIDFEESERQLQEKMDLMNAFKLRPVNPSNLRDVRINKVVVTPLTRNQKGNQSQPAQPNPMRAKKTFPQPKKPDEGRSELTSKNSMVYIPIQPPASQAPVRQTRPVPSVVTTPPQNRIVTITSTGCSSSVNNAVNTNTPPLVFTSPLSGTPATPVQTVSALGSVMPNVGQMPNIGQGPTVGQVPSTVHTMPLITSVNGQWTFSLQPVLSVGGVDGAPSPPMVNGVADRSAMLPITPGSAPSGPILVPAAPPVLATQQATNSNNNNNNSRTTETTPGEPPRLQQRPSLVNPLDSNAPVGNVPPPSTVGPLTAKLNQNAVKMTDFFRTLLEDSIEKLDEPVAQVTNLKLQLEQVQWRHKQEVDEIKHNHELTLAEMRSSFEKEKVRLVAETRRQSQLELDAAVKQAKTKQWCANCNQEAQFYCCWNTAYCDYPCQRAHWATHYAVCAQPRLHPDGNSDISSHPPEGRLQQAPDNLPKTTAAPNLAAGKLQPSRMYTHEPVAQQKTSIIVSMVEDNTGNQTMKCVGTYKPPTGTQISPLIINKQIMTNEETGKKVVTSGGYLIVGGSNPTNTTTINPARRATAIQYIS